MSDISTVYDLLDSTAKRYPIKALVEKVDPDKSESTFRGELNRQPGHKLALSTSIKIIEVTGDYSALDAIEEMMGRVAFVIPKPEPGDTIKNIMSLVASLTREFSCDMDAMARAIDDGVINKKEAFRCLAKNKSLIKECLKIQAHLEGLL